MAYTGADRPDLPGTDQSAGRREHSGLLRGRAEDEREQLDHRRRRQRGPRIQPDAAGVPQRGCDCGVPDAARNLLGCSLAALPPGQVNVVTRSRHQLPSMAARMSFFRNDILQANNYFSNLSGLKRPPLRYNDFGYTIGGPVYHPQAVQRARQDVLLLLAGVSAGHHLFSRDDVPADGKPSGRGCFRSPSAPSVNSAGTCNNAGTTQISELLPAGTVVSERYLRDASASKSGRGAGYASVYVQRAERL